MELVDTDVLIDSLRRGEMRGDAVSVLTVLEFLRGMPEGDRERAKELLEEAFEVIGLDNEVIIEYCRLYDRLRERGELLGDADLIIGATAISKGMDLLTGNERQFARLKEYGLRLGAVGRRSDAGKTE